jgi:hypothetical protein
VSFCGRKKVTLCGKKKQQDSTIHYLKKKAYLLFAVLLLMLVCAPAHAQSPWSNIRSIVLDLRNKPQVVDTLTLLPSLLFAADSTTGCPIPLKYFTISNRSIRIDSVAVQRICPAAKRLQITYRVLPTDLAKPIFRLDTALIRRFGNDGDVAFDYSPYETPNTNPFAAPGVLSTGTYTRGLSVGNSQNLVFNSNLNLQIEGKLGNDLTVRGALSDNSIPLQPDGTTRRLQEFDRIFIELERKGTILSAGDLDLLRPGGYFTNYFKRIQGAKLVLPGTKKQPAMSGGVGVSRGKFNRQIVQGQEGNQGPYRLQGAEGERFIIVLAGTEKVFADGQLLQRGQADDYVVDYNLGEVIFTQKRLITKDIRIIIEFEYAVQNYLRSTVTARAEWPVKKGRFWLNMYSEQDGLNATGNLDLTPDQRSRLAQAGDNLTNAFASGVDTLEAFEPSRVLYRYRDTLVCNSVIPILEYSTNTESALYAARFSEVPTGQGNYIQAPNSANGRVYRWVAPDPVTCLPTGNFEPVVRLIAPEQRQLHTVGGEYQLSKKTFLFGEAALSQRDLNRYSPLDNGDNLGGGGFLRIQHKTTKGNWTAILDGNAELTTATFLPLNPYRPAEFVRDWNVLPSTTPMAEQIIKMGLSIEKKQLGDGRYEFAQFNRIGQYNGQRHTVRVNVLKDGWGLLGEMNELSSSGLVERTRFSRPKFDLSKTMLFKSKTPVLKMGLYAEREKNTRSNIAADTLQNNGFWYDLARFYVQMPNLERAFFIGGYASQRNDYAPLKTAFAQSTSANDININGRWEHGGDKIAKKPPPGTLEWNFTYRNLRIIDQNITTEKGQNTYLGRLDYRFSAFKNGLSATTGYELGSGQSPKIEFNYLLVNPGEGLYAWIDRNRDSILQVDEMEISVFQDQASYVRVAVTTPEYLRSNNAVFNQNLRIEPRLWMPPNAKGWKKWVGRTAAQSTLQINRRVLAGVGGISPWNPFQLTIADSALITVNATTRHVLFLNRANPRWDASISYGDNRSRILVTTGFESRRLEDQVLHLRTNLSQQWSWETDLTNARRSNETESFATRNYKIDGLEISPKLTWLPVRSFRIVGKFSWKNRKNTLGEQEKAEQRDFNIETSWNPTTKTKKSGGFSAATALRAKATLADIRYTGQANTPISFAMLDGLQNGRNLLWNLTLDRQLSKTIQLNLTYEGRRTGTNARVVHIGRAQVRAVF